MTLARTMVVAACGALLIASVAAAQNPTRSAPGGTADDKVGVNIALQVGSSTYQFNGRGSCTHEPKAYIYETAAKLWRVQQDEAQRSVSLTFWSPASGSADMFSLHVTTGGKTHATSTVKTASGGSLRGAGAVTFAAAGKGGTFTIRATSAAGAAISGTITCDAFTAAIAVGGN